jgi:hypothetical protein
MVSDPVFYELLLLGLLWLCVRCWGAAVHYVMRYIMFLTRSYG